MKKGTLKLVLIFMFSAPCISSVYTPSNLKYFKDNQITPENVGNLVKVFDIGVEGIGNFQSTPVNLDNSLIVVYPGVGIGVNDLDTGEQRCVFEHAIGPTMRGITVNERNIYFPSFDGNIYSFSVDDCAGNSSFGLNGIVKTNQMSLLPPIIDKKRNLIIHAGLLGVVSVFDFKKGTLLHQIDMRGNKVIPRIWSGFSYSPELGIAYVVTSNSGFLSNFDIQDNDLDLSGALVAIDVINGKIKFSIKELNKELWDLDFVGPPLIMKFADDDIRVVALSKTGAVIYVDGKTGEFIFPPAKYSNGSLDITRPDRIGDIVYNPVEELAYFDSNTRDYVLHKLRHSRFERFFVQSISFDRVLFGLHGGPEWPGGSYDPLNKLLMIPVNRVPWIVRHEYIYQGTSIDRTKILGYESYLNQCADCHGSDLNGERENETTGDYYVPSLVGAAKKYNLQNLGQCNYFLNLHRFVKHSVDCNKLPEVLEFLETDYIDLKSSGKLISKGFWQYLLTQDKLPAATPPWGKIIALDIETGRTRWTVPFGIEEKSGTTGDFNLGGVVSTSGGILIANGTRDAKARIFEIKSGKLLWEYQLNAPGASPPLTYTYKGCQYIAFNASGGKFWRTERQGKYIEVFKLSDCKLSEATRDAISVINNGSFDITTTNNQAEAADRGFFEKAIDYFQNHTLVETWDKILNKLGI